MTSLFLLPLLAASLSPQPEIQQIPFDIQDVPKEARIRGTPVSGSRFLDKTGENFVVLTKQTMKPKDGGLSVYLRVYHYRMGAHKISRVRLVKDMTEACRYDNVTDFHADSLGVTDLDGDGIGEITFAYQADCVSGLSPVQTKLMVLEGGRKYVLRGTTRLEMPGESPLGGAIFSDESLSRAPKPIRRYARERWNDYVRHYH